VPIGGSDYGDPLGAANMFLIILAGLIVCGSADRYASALFGTPG
jgi:hypothetical protein